MLQAITSRPSTFAELEKLPNVTTLAYRMICAAVWGGARRYPSAPPLRAMAMIIAALTARA
jgi:hypothetical protein